MILTVGNTKGGVGKTTVALNLAVVRARAGRDVWFVDGDRQGTAQAAISLRTDARREPVLACATYPDGSALRGQIAHQRHKFDDIIIDAGGRDSSALRAALGISDAVLVPFQPRSYDVWALDNMAGLIDEVLGIRNGLRAYAVMNLADPGSRSRDNDQAAEAVAGLDCLEYLPTPLRRRKAFANAAGVGLSVLETRPVDKLAVGEISALAETLF